MRFVLIIFSVFILSACATKSNLVSNDRTHVKGNNGYILMSMSLGIRPINGSSMIYKAKEATAFDYNQIFFNNTKFKLFEVPPGEYYFYQMIADASGNNTSLKRMHLKPAYFTVYKDVVTSLGHIIPQKYEQQEMDSQFIEKWLINNFPNIATGVTVKTKKLQLIPLSQ